MAGMFLTLHFDGNTSTTVELIWRFIKLHWFDFKIPVALAQLLEPFMRAFAADQKRFLAGSHGVMATVGTSVECLFSIAPLPQPSLSPCTLRMVSAP